MLSRRSSCCFCRFKASSKFLPRNVSLGMTSATLMCKLLPSFRKHQNLIKSSRDSSVASSGWYIYKADVSDTDSLKSTQKCANLRMKRLRERKYIKQMMTPELISYGNLIVIDHQHLYFHVAMAACVLCVTRLLVHEK